jgi:hypothetical protein
MQLVEEDFVDWSTNRMGGEIAVEVFQKAS